MGYRRLPVATLQRFSQRLSFATQGFHPYCRLNLYEICPTASSREVDGASIVRALRGELSFGSTSLLSAVDTDAPRKPGFGTPRLSPIVAKTRFCIRRKHHMSDCSTGGCL